MLHPEEAIVSLCGLTWFVAWLLDENLVVGARVRIMLHKTRSSEEDGDLWFNNECNDVRAAAAIKDDGNNALYMYESGNAVDHGQSQLLGGLVVVCKSWQWAALVHAATRMIALTSNNTLGPLVPDLMTLNKDADITSPGSSPLDNS